MIAPTEPLPLLMVTVYDPWATALLRTKTVENRPWRPANPRAAGPFVLVVHRAVRYDAHGDEVARQLDPGLPARDHLELLRGTIAGAVLIGDTPPVSAYRGVYSADPWAVGPRCWRVTHRWPATEAARYARFQGRQGVTYLDEQPELRARILELLPEGVRLMLPESWDPSWARTCLGLPADPRDFDRQLQQHPAPADWARTPSRTYGDRHPTCGPCEEARLAGHHVPGCCDDRDG